MLQVGALDEVDDSTVGVRRIECTLEFLYLRE